jgi:hypothetical protein
MSAEQPSDRRLLRSWKEIAAHLKVDVRTAQRWQRASSIPIARRAMGGRGHPVAYTDDLDRWQAEQHRSRVEVPTPEPPDARSERVRPAIALPRRWPAWAVVALAVIGTLGASASWWWPRPQVFRVEVMNRTVHAFDSAGTQLWQAALPGSGENHLSGGTVEGDRALLADITGDGRTDVVVRIVATPAGGDLGRVVAFTHRGHPLWDRPIDNERTLNGILVRGRMTPLIMRAVTARGRTWLLVVSGHHVQPASQAVLLDVATGAVVEEYWHPGLVTSGLVTDLDGDAEPEVVLGGVLNPRGGFGHAAVVVLDVPFSVRPRHQGGLSAFTGGAERSYAVMPRPDICAAAGDHPFVRTLTMEGNRIVAAATCGGVSVVYWFNQDLTLSQARLSDLYTWAHDRLTTQGSLDHRLSDDEARCLRQALRSDTAVDVEGDARPAAWLACR